METMFKTQENTKVFKSFHGWMGETTMKLNGTSWVITTMKRYSGVVSANAQEVNDEGKGSYSFMPFQDKSITILSEKVTATEAKIKELHLKALALFDQMSEAGKLPKKSEEYKFEVGQILFLNGYGQDEHSHERKAVYKIADKKYYYVNLDTLRLGQTQVFTVKDIENKFGIGTYFKKGDCVDMETINNAVIEATQNEARIAEEERTNKELANAATNAKLEIGGEKLTCLPSGVKAVIIAERREDKSDPMTDYFGYSTEETVYLAFSHHTKDLFPEMRKAAENFEHTKCYGIGKGIFKPIVLIDKDFYSNGSYYRQGEPSGWTNNDDRPEFQTEAEAQAYIEAQPPLKEISFEGVPVPFKWSIRESRIEHREKYSMGEGYYLGESSRRGWIVRKRNIDERSIPALQIAIAEGKYFIPERSEGTNSNTSEALPTGEVKAVLYSDKAIAVYGDTYPIKDQLKANGGRFNKFLTINGERVAGWIFPASNAYAQGLLTRLQ